MVYSNYLRARLFFTLFCLTVCLGGFTMLKVHIFIIGMAGAGKSSLGHRLAQNMSIRFVDTDQRVCEMLGMPSLRSICQVLGEPIFRNAETGALMELVGQEPAVISTGSGICNDNINVTLMKNHGVIIHVDRPLDQLLADIHSDEKQKNPVGAREDVIQEYNRQIGFYKAARDLRLDNSKGFNSSFKSLTDMVDQVSEGGPFPSART